MPANSGLDGNPEGCKFESCPRSSTPATSPAQVHQTGQVRLNAEASESRISRVSALVGDAPVLCECGCGQRTRLAPCSAASKGWVKGQPLRFVNGHRQRMPNPLFRQFYPPAIDRFFDKITALDDDQGGCWIWVQQPATARYARFEGKQGHAWSYEYFVGPIPAGLEIDHLCRNTWCVNPEHLEPVTHAENMRRGINATKTHCVHGHERTPENTYRDRTGRRPRCKPCHLERCRVRWANRGAAA